MPIKIDPNARYSSRACICNGGAKIDIVSSYMGLLESTGEIRYYVLKVTQAHINFNCDRCSKVEIDRAIVKCIREI